LLRRKTLAQFACLARQLLLALLEFVGLLLQQRRKALFLLLLLARFPSPGRHRSREHGRSLRFQQRFLFHQRAGGLEVLALLF
jgi:hypothetical protein